MQNPYVLWLSLVVFLPALGALVLAFIPKSLDETLRYVTLVVTAVVLVLCIALFLVPGDYFQFAQANEAASYMQDVFNVPWIPSFDIYYYMGIDGISFPLVLLTALVSFLAMGASWSVTKHVKAYCILFLLLETGMLGVFLALDFFLFYVFWEVMLLPMYFLIGVWGGPRREYAAIKFFLYTLFGSVLMLVAILLLYFNGDLRELARVDIRGTAGSTLNWDQLHVSPTVEQRLGRTRTEPGDRENARVVFQRVQAAADKELDIVFETGAASTVALFDADNNQVSILLADAGNTAADVVAAINANPLLATFVDAALPPGSDGSGIVLADDSLTIPAFSPEQPVHSFNLLALAAMGQHTDVFSRTLQCWAFVLLFIGFIIKVPSVPLHTWLPDAHVEAPTPISMILAGVLLKMGGYGIIRICYPICPFGGYDLAWIVCLVGVVSMVYGAFAALAQKDFKRLVAYSSVSHMGYVVLGLGVWSATAPFFNPDYWNMGVKGAMFQMIGHGISSAGMFFMVGVVYDRVHHRDLNQFGGLFGKMPVYTALSIGIFFAALGLPGLCGFIGEVLVVLSVWRFDPTLAIISAAVVILTAGYILWTIQRVYLGAEYRGPHEEALVPTNARENVIAGVLFVLAIVLGVAPYQSVLRYMDPTIDRQVQQLTAWTEQQSEREWSEERMSGAASLAESAPARPQVKASLVNQRRPDVDGVAAAGSRQNLVESERERQRP